MLSFSLVVGKLRAKSRPTTNLVLKIFVPSPRPCRTYLGICDASSGHRQE